MLCSDKTGTLTANKLSLNDPYIAPDVDPNWLMTVSPRYFSPSRGVKKLICIIASKAAVLASSHNVKSLDPIDKVTIIGLKVTLRLQFQRE